MGVEVEQLVRAGTRRVASDYSEAPDQVIGTARQALGALRDREFTLRPFHMVNLVAGVLVWGFFGALLLLQVAIEDYDRGNRYWMSLVCTLGAVVCFVLYRRVRDQTNWGVTSTAMKWLYFLVTPWGVILGFGIGVFIAGFLALVGGGGGSSGSRSSGGLPYQGN